jgi:alpha-tubulin suppressor-like RCC1 family protein
LGLTDITDVRINMNSTFAVSSAGGLQSWGYNGYGELGSGSTFGSELSPLSVYTSGVTAVSSGHGYHGCAIYTGNLMCWGYNYYGQLGIGTKTNSNQPMSVIF